jgi:hypothetical protein
VFKNPAVVTHDKAGVIKPMEPREIEQRVQAEFVDLAAQ